MNIAIHSTSNSYDLDWLEKSPARWPVMRLKDVAHLIMGQSPLSEDCSTDPIGLPFLQGCAEFGIAHPSPKVYCRSPAKVSPKGTILVSVRAPVGRLNVADQRYGIGRGLCGIIPDERTFLTAYARYSLEASVIALGRLSTGSTYDAVSVSDVAGLSVPIPPLREQAVITAFLDQETECIDNLVKKLKTLVDRLREKCMVLISHTVTHGLLPESAHQSSLNLESQLRPSGIDWLGDIKRDWQIRQLKTLCSRSALYGANLAATHYANDGVRFLRTTDITDNGKIREEGVFIPDHLAHGYLLSDGDLIISRSGTIGRSLLYDSKVHGPCAYAGYLVRFVPKCKILARYIYWFTRSKSFDMFLKMTSISSTIENVNGEKYANLLIPLPHPQEQLQIAEFLEQKTVHIDTTISKIEALITRFIEYRSALVTAAVTGAIDLRKSCPRIACERSSNLDAQNVTSATMPSVFQDSETACPSASTVFRQRPHGGDT